MVMIIIIKNMTKQPVIPDFRRLGCQFAFFFHQKDQQPVFESNCERFLSASIIKVPILLAWLHLERQGLVDSHELCDLDSEPQVQGAGFSWLMGARKLPYHDVLLMMIALSDNLCTNLVIEKVGRERLTNVIQQDLGLKGTELQRKLMDYAAREKGLDNWITAQDCIKLFDLVDDLPTQQRAIAESMLASNQDDALLKRNIPRDTVDFYHKTGSISNVLHDWGYTRSCRIFLLMQNVKAEPPAFDVFGQAGEWMLQ
jgi:beta-lactamase class A